ncbi:hypothetical protein NDU88_002373 [Pleurodeles waltl]|uniref:Uncharacterized protein n=1 Tax=Pleurodeles waltl TaxID=8319 RepID=A0AAV7P6K7_PLEWA|nr:hypothetical protein NDU88_002373 [Pleurodeles waltl]
MLANRRRGSDKEREVFKKASSKLFKTEVIAESLSFEEWLSNDVIYEFSDDSNDQETQDHISGESSFLNHPKLAKMSMSP